MPLFRSTRAAKSSKVSGVSALIVKSDTPSNVPRMADVLRPVLELQGGGPSRATHAHRHERVRAAA
jgi:hypothetical protein